MDKIANYREIIRRELRGYADWTSQSNANLRVEIVYDPVLDHFELICFGWQGTRRIHSILFHIDLIDGKVWIQRDGTNRPIAEEFVRAGIAKEDIVLAEQPAELRPLTGYGVG